MITMLIVVITKIVGIICFRFLAVAVTGQPDLELGLGSWGEAMHKLRNSQHWQHTRSTEVRYMHRAPNMTLALDGQQSIAPKVKKVDSKTTCPGRRSPEERIPG